MLLSLLLKGHLGCRCIGACGEGDEAYSEDEGQDGEGIAWHLPLPQWLYTVERHGHETSNQSDLPRRHDLPLNFTPHELERRIPKR